MNTMIITNDIRDILLLISECVNIFCVEGVGNLFICEKVRKIVILVGKKMNKK